MKQHPIDPISLVSGLAFLLVAGGYALSNTTDAHLRWLFVIPVVLIVAGAGILGTVAHRAATSSADRATIDDDAEAPGTN
jgi:hypothetical protein